MLTMCVLSGNYSAVVPVPDARTSHACATAVGFDDCGREVVPTIRVSITHRVEVKKMTLGS